MAESGEIEDSKTVIALLMIGKMRATATRENLW